MTEDKTERLALYMVLGLTPKEGEIYDLLLNRGEMSARKIEVETGLKKNTYQLLRSLLSKNLAYKKTNDTHVYYGPTSPEELRVLMNEKMKQTRLQAGELLTKLPELLRIYGVSVGVPTVTYVESSEELRELYRTLYAELKGDTYGCLDLALMKKAIPGLMDEELIPERNKNSSHAYAVLADNEAGRETASRDKEEGRTSILLDSKEYPLPAEISVYRDKVVLMSFKAGRARGFVIRDPDMVTSLTSLYRYMFKS